MTEPKKQTRSKKAKAAANTANVFESSALGLQSLRLIAAPNPADDLSEADLEDLAQQKRYPVEMIQNIIQYVKSL